MSARRVRFARGVQLPERVEVTSRRVIVSLGRRFVSAVAQLGDCAPAAHEPIRPHGARARGERVVQRHAGDARECVDRPGRGFGDASGSHRYG